MIGNRLLRAGARFLNFLAQAANAQVQSDTEPPVVPVPSVPAAQPVSAPRPRSSAQTTASPVDPGLSDAELLDAHDLITRIEQDAAERERWQKAEAVKFRTTCLVRSRARGRAERAEQRKFGVESCTYDGGPDFGAEIAKWMQLHPPMPPLWDDAADDAEDIRAEERLEARLEARLEEERREEARRRR